MKLAHLILAVLIVALAAPSVNADCSVHKDCKSCASDMLCDYCALAGASQGSGTCYSTANVTKLCPTYGASIVYTPSQCGLNLTCADYDASCNMCSYAPAALNCGWCADGVAQASGKTQHCVSGTASYPNYGTCGYNSWGWKGTSCSSVQAECNTFNNQGCGACLTNGGNCGYCETTGRCEYILGTSPYAGDCPAANFSSSYCKNGVDPCSVYDDNCYMCTAQSGCGYCASGSGGKCVLGGTYSPSNPNVQCSSSNWTNSYSYCPSSSCQYYSNECSMCVSSSNCGYCESTGACYPARYGSPVGHTCPSTFDTYSYQCPNSPTPYPDYTDSYSSAGTWAIILMVLALILLILRVLRISLRPPIHGIGLLPGMAVPAVLDDCSRFGWLIVCLGSIGLKLAAIFYDRWDEAFTLNGQLQYIYGAYQLRMIVQSNTFSESYNTLCDGFNGSDSFSINQQSYCHTLQGAGILTLIFMCMSVLFSLILLIFILMGMANKERISVHAVKMWKFAALSLTSVSTASFIWIFSGNMIVHHWYGYQGVGSSWFMNLGSFVADLILIILFRRLIKYTPSPLPNSPFAPNPYQPVGVQQPVYMTPVQPVAVNAVPAGYGQPPMPQYYVPPSQQQQYAAYAAQQQRYQPNISTQPQQNYVPPAYNPQRTF